MRVGMCDCECVWLFLCQIGLRLLPLLDQFRTPIKCGAYFLQATLPDSGWCLCPLVYWWFSASGAGCFGVCRLTPGGCLGGDVPRDLVSLGPWPDLLRRRRLLVGPVGMLLQLPGVSALRLLGGSPGALLCSSLGGLR
ncbi:hypothetical protein ILYODFUR_006557 [Ilyodon furcidens]|uniref:Uncharacterized protein n=1 Tax=Ilyodon furcidens TaxID=33524 RepID=A0ABV0V0U2_9TELE